MFINLEYNVALGFDLYLEIVFGVVSKFLPFSSLFYWHRKIIRLVLVSPTSFVSEHEFS